MEIIINIFNEVIQDKNLPLLFVFCLCAFGFSIIEDILGTLLGTINEGFDFKKKLLGLVKRIAIGLTIMAFGFIVDYFVVALNNLPSIEIGTEIVTVLEIVAMVVTWCIDSARKIIEKLKSIKELQYTKYEDIKYNDGTGVSL